MSNGFITHVRRFVSLSEKEEEQLLSVTTTTQVKKKDFLLKEGQVCQSSFFVLAGCLRAFFINEKGIEQTCQFAIENWWITDFMSLDNRQASHFYIQAVEKSVVIALGRQQQEDLFLQIPSLERYFRKVIQKSYAASQLRIKYLFSQSGEERYHHFNEAFPEFVQRVPQYMLASYLGFTPEFLSKIRAGKT